MRFLDALKMALHNIWHNKSRTALTVIIVLIVGTLLMVLNIFAISFYNNMNEVSKVIFNEKGTTYSFNSYYDRKGSGSSETESFTKKEIETFLGALDEYDDVIDYVNVPVYTNCRISLDATLESSGINLTNGIHSIQSAFQLSDTGVNMTSFMIPANFTDGFLLSGRAWTKSDSGTANIWLTDKCVEEIYKVKGQVLKAGDKISYLSEIYNHNAQTYDSTVKTFTICGILDSAKMVSVDSSYYGSNNTAGIYMDFGYYTSFSSIQDIWRIELAFKPSATEYNFPYVYGRILAFEDAINGSAEVRQLDAGMMERLMGYGKRLSADIVSQMSLARFAGTLVIAVVLLISLIIILLSAGSIANSIIISTDKNKKFIGLMKALGLKNKGVNKIINLEAALQIFIGVAVSFLVLYLLQPLIFEVLTLSLGSIFRSMARGIEYTLALYMPIYIPVAVFAIFLMFALLSAKGSLSKLGKMDVIAIMSEAA